MHLSIFQFPEFGNNDMTELFKAYPKRALLMLNLIEDVMSATEEVSLADKELIFAFTSYQNACHYCFESHLQMAQAYGIPEATFERITQDLDQADIDPRMKAVLKFVEKLSNNPSRIVGSDLKLLEEHGLSEAASLDIICVCALANYMNRFVDGSGIDTTTEQARENGLQCTARGGYRSTVEYLQSQLGQ